MKYFILLFLLSLNIRAELKNADRVDLLEGQFKLKQNQDEKCLQEISGVETTYDGKYRLSLGLNDGTNGEIEITNLNLGRTYFDDDGEKFIYKSVATYKNNEINFSAIKCKGILITVPFSCEAPIKMYQIKILNKNEFTINFFNKAYWTSSFKNNTSCSYTRI